MAGGAAEAEEESERPAGAKPPSAGMGRPPTPPAKGLPTAMPADATNGPEAAEEGGAPKAGANAAEEAPAAGGKGR